MSEVRIKNGRGVGNYAEVDSDGRLVTLSTTQTDVTSIVQNGRGFVVSTGIITLTDDSESAILYALINENSDVLITDLTYQFGPSTGGSNPALVNQYVAITGGTLVTDADPAAVGNYNTGSNVSLDTATLNYKGDQGKTVTGISIGSDLVNVGGPQHIVEGGIIVTKGSNIALTVTPPTGNTNMQILIRVSLYLLDYV